MQHHPLEIRSSSNALFKQVNEVSRGKDRSRILLEGVRLLGDALLAGTPIESIWVRENRVGELVGLPKTQVPIYALPGSLYDRLGSVKNPPPVMALGIPPEDLDLDELPRDGDPLVLVIAGVSDPGNLGALARSAEAAGACALIQVGAGVHHWNPKALRGSMGSLLRLPATRISEAREAQVALTQIGYRHVSAATRGGMPMGHLDWSGPIALWVSGETGEAPTEMDAMESITIPLAGGVESLNVTVAASLLLFAAGRVSDGQGNG